MNRRDTMKLFGLGAAAASTPIIVAAPVAAAPKIIPHILHERFNGRLTVRVTMRGGRVYGARATRHPDVTTVKLSFNSHFSGVVDSIMIFNDGYLMLTMGAENMNTPFIVSGSVVDIEVTNR